MGVTVMDPAAGGDMRWKTSWNLENLNLTSYFTALKL